jgi:WD40 repeat protein
MAGKALGAFEEQVSGTELLEVSRDGKLLVTSGRDGLVRTWNVATGREMRRLIQTGKALESLLLSPDGKRLLTRSFNDAEVRLWDVETGKELRPLPIDKDSGLGPAGLAFSPDGIMVAMGGRAPRLWQAATGRERARLSAEVGAFAVAFTPDGKGLITLGFDQKVRLFSTDSGKEKRAYAAAPPALNAAVSPDAKLLAVTAFDNRIVVLDLASGKETAQWMVFPGYPLRLAFTSDSKRLAAFTSFGVRFYDPETGKDLAPLVSHRSTILAAAFRDGGRAIATVGQDRALRLWEASTGRQARVVTDLPGPLGHIEGATLTPDGGLAAVPGGPQPQSIYFYDVGTFRERFKPLRPPGQFSRLALSADGQYLGIALPYPVFQGAWDIASGEERFRGKGEGTLALAPQDDLLAAVTTPAGALALWDLREKRSRLAIPAAMGWRTQHLAFSADGAMLAVGGDGLVRVYETATGGERFRFLAYRNMDVSALTFAPDGRTLATGNSNGLVNLWEARASIAQGKDRDKNPPLGHELRRFTGHTGEVRTLAFAPAGDRLVSGSADTTALVWDLKCRAPGPPTAATPEELEKLWTALAGEAGPACEAIQRLADLGKRSPSWLRERLAEKAAVRPDDLRTLRALEAIERAGGPAAREALEALAQARPKLAERASSALARLKAREAP